jgi:hypothetical protein
MASTGALILACLVAVLQLPACSRSNNLLLGRVEAQVGPYTVAVTDCYRIEAPPPEKLDDTPDGSPVYRFAPCKDADVRIEGSRLFVNGASYGSLTPGDTVVVDHGKVLVNNVAATVRDRRF